MSENHLIIGLGGTGGKILRELRKIVFQQFRSEKPRGANVEYLYVDSSDEDMGLDDDNWKILGTSVQLGKKNQLLITEGDLVSRIENASQYPGIKPWIGDRRVWEPYLRSIQGTKAAGGQRRRLGRFLFACNVDNFRSQLDLLVRSLHQSGSNTAVTFHLCCGLAGGTGSGAIVDAVAQIRASYPNKKDRILLYTLLPETHPNPLWALSGYYQANGYAALLELNALSVGAFDPHDVSGQHERLRLSDPFNGCYVFSNENENGVPVDIVKELPAIVADFLFQKIVAVADGTAWDQLRRMENAENGDSKPETDGKSLTPKRSKRFLTFGIKRLAIPEEEITEYLTYSFARQAALQLRYNHWTESSGFVDEAKNQDFHQLVRQREVQERWLLTDEHLTLSLGILADDAANPRWKALDAEWQTVLPVFKTMVRTNFDEKLWIDELAKMAEKRFASDYRGLGVAAFYKNKHKSRRDHAREIRRRVEAELINDWKNGVRSMADIAAILAALREALEERGANLARKVGELKAEEERVFARVTANAHEWSQVGLVAGWMGKRDRIFDAQGVSLQELYILRTRNEALQFAQKLAEDLVSEVDELKSEVDRASATVTASLKSFENAIAARLNDPAGRFDFKQQLIRFYNSEEVKKTTSRLIKDENEQKTQASRVRQALLERLGDTPGFARFNERINRTIFVDTLEKQCKESAEIAHHTLVTRPKEKLLGVDIIAKLKERYADPQELAGFVADLVKHAGNFAIFNEAELNNSEAGQPGQICTRSFAVLLPKSNDEFVKVLREAFERSVGAGRGGLQFVETTGRANEICLVSLTNLMPLRTLELVKFLEGRYRSVLEKAGNQAEARTFLHLEGDGTQLPGIFGLSVRQEAAPYLLLGKALGVLIDYTSPATGKTSLVMMTQDEYGLDRDAVQLGSSLLDAQDGLEAGALQELIDAIDATLKSAPYLHVDKRNEVRQAIVAEMQRIKELCGNDVQNADYRKYNEAARTAIQNVLKG